MEQVAKLEMEKRKNYLNAMIERRFDNLDVATSEGLWLKERDGEIESRCYGNM